MKEVERIERLLAKLETYRGGWNQIEPKHIPALVAELRAMALYIDELQAELADERKKVKL